MSRYRYLHRHAFTLVELLTVMAIIGVLAGLLLPAIAGAREAMRRATCVSNMAQVAKAVRNFESTYKLLPTAGKGIDKSAFQAFLDPNVTSNKPVYPTGVIKAGRYIPYTSSGTAPYEISPSVFLQILPYLDNSPIFDQYNFAYEYNDVTASKAPDGTSPSTSTAYDLTNLNMPRFGNVGTSTTYLSFLRCPSNPLLSQRDPFKFGSTDYAASVYTDIYAGQIYTPAGPSSPAGSYVPVSAQEGALGLKKVASSTIKDGEANTILMVEDAGRADGFQGYHTLATSDRVSPVCIANPKLGYGCAAALDDTTNYNYYSVHRWADSNAAAIGISGAIKQEVSNVGSMPAGYINNSNTKLGGGPNASWVNHNFGNNQEAYSFHRGGVNVSLVDGSTHFLSEQIDAVTLRFLVTKAEKHMPSTPPFE